MPSFVLVTEGITDQIALDAILSGHYDSKDIEIIPLQPLRDETDKSRQAGFANWELVFEFCENIDILAEALSYNDFLIIQIDTDCGDHPNYGAALTTGGVDKPDAELVNEVRDLLINRLTTHFFEKYRDRIIFAICVHSLECWILPLYTDKRRTKACEKHLMHALEAQKWRYGKDAACYRKLTKGYEKRKILEAHRSDSISLDIFLKSLPDKSALIWT